MIIYSFLLIILNMFKYNDVDKMEADKYINVSFQINDNTEIVYQYDIKQDTVICLTNIIPICENVKIIHNINGCVSLYCITNEAFTKCYIHNIDENNNIDIKRVLKSNHVFLIVKDYENNTLF